MGRNPIISRASAAATALKLIDDDGLDNLNLDRIAKALGVRAPSLYHHFKDKAELLSEVAKLVFTEVDLHHDTEDWREHSVLTSLSVYRTVLRHPNVAGLLIELQPDRVALPAFELTAVRLEAAGVDPTIRRLIMEGTEKITWGWTLHEAMRMQRRARQDTAASLAARFPTLARAYDDNPWNEEEMLETTLRAFIDGAVALAADRKVASAARPSRGTNRPAGARPTRRPAAKRTR